MEFLLYLTPMGNEIYNLISHKVSIIENAPICRQKNIYGWFDHGKKSFVICTSRIKQSGNPHHYINETLYHESVHVAQNCKSFFRLGLSPLEIPNNTMKLYGVKYTDWKNSISMVGNDKKNTEKEAYYLEDKPEKVLDYVKKYCF
jgi:hypothetical protein